MRTDDHVDAGGDHGGGVDQSRDRRGAFHGVRQPDVERNLRRFAGCTQDQQQRDGGEESALPLGMLGELAGDSAEAERAEVGDEQKHRQQEAEVADAVDDEGLFARLRSGVLLEVEADQQVRGEPHALPADEHEQEVLRQHQREHEEHEEVEVGEEPPVTLFVRHVTDGVDVDQEADAGDDKQHDQRELIEGEGEVRVEAGVAIQAACRSM